MAKKKSTFNFMSVKVKEETKSLIEQYATQEGMLHWAFMDRAVKAYVEEIEKTRSMKTA